MVERRLGKRPSEPGTFRYLRQIGNWVPGDSMVYAQLLDATRTIDALGPGLVEHFGVINSRFIASEVGRLAQEDLEKDPGNKVAMSAARWARKAETRITDQGWQNPIDH